ncbi:adenylosuccinate synthetase [Candidatus Woesearchaeota archaeon]|nr:adenylosuccinate synthetase [Candidatus Woesearchaeota archaeon]
MLDLREITEQEWKILRAIDPKTIPELSCAAENIYIVASIDEILNPIIRKNDVIVVCGAFFGDEGKGKIVDAIANHPDIRVIARVNSGENAGHTVWHDGRKYVFHLAPSGLLIPGKTNVIGPECVMDPVSFMEDELSQVLRDDITPDLVVGNVHIVAPYHKLADLARNGRSNSSTLKGMSPVHASKAVKACVRLDQLFGSRDKLTRAIRRDLEFSYNPIMQITSEEELLERCAEINERAKKRDTPGIPSHLIGFLEAPTGEKADYLIDLYLQTVMNKQFPKRGDALRIIDTALRQNEKVLLEAAQAYYLSNGVETHFGSSTSANTTSAGTKAAAGYNQEKYRSATINVTKFPPSRVGRGANPCGLVPQTFFSDRKYNSLDDLAGVCEDFDGIQAAFWKSIGENGILKKEYYTDADGKHYLLCETMAISSSRKHGECGATTKKPRVLGIMDCVAQHHVNQKQGPYLSISALDRGDEYDKIGLVVAYVVLREGESNGATYMPGQIIRPGDQLPNEQVLENCLPVIKVMDGWKDDPIGGRKFQPGKDLPRALNNFIGVYAKITGSNVINFGNGQDTKALVYIQKSEPDILTCCDYGEELD